MKKEDIIGIAQGYIGLFILSYAMCWTHYTYNVWGISRTFFTTFGGLL